ncbi:hypothetical protein JAAARDRAFT_52076 [Jaapia argillacea MUCL 33604]|uniref:Uncharacterized protein n=1 Tax=Jaapia argillacea MUCL 33604 TaxID=933084 RepID=A0A067QN71_9AGAM|nr:hypothetical protein JAAARDRAFT_52076 [Jaapia argillacea MUCL 33604]
MSNNATASSSTSHKRLSTIHDLASLRLHPDGTRVLPSLPSKHHAIKPKRNAERSNTDLRGNRIATDAGGSGRVKRRKRRVVNVNAEEGEEEEGDGERRNVDLSGVGLVMGLGDGALPSGAKGKGKERSRDSDYEQSEEDSLKDVRAKKRRRFLDDLSFLDRPPLPSTATPPVTTNPSEASTFETHRAHEDGQPSYPVEFPNHIPYDQPPPNLPSSDLLKCIHHFASTYYTSKSQLFDSTREARLVKKQRRLDRLNDAASLREGSVESVRSRGKGRGRGNDRGSTGNSKKKRKRDDGNTTEEDEVLLDENERLAATTAARGKKKKGRRSTKSKSRAQSTDGDGEAEGGEEEEVDIEEESEGDELRRDMYKAFDGSALLALGMLLQTHVKSLLTPHIPPSWEEEMEEFQVGGYTSLNARQSLVAGSGQEGGKYPTREKGKRKQKQKLEDGKQEVEGTGEGEEGAPSGQTRSKGKGKKKAQDPNKYSSPPKPKPKPAPKPRRKLDPKPSHEGPSQPSTLPKSSMAPPSLPPLFTHQPLSQPKSKPSKRPKTKDVITDSMELAAEAFASLPPPFITNTGRVNVGLYSEELARRMRMGLAREGEEVDEGGLEAEELGVRRDEEEASEGDERDERDGEEGGSGRRMDWGVAGDRSRSVSVSAFSHGSDALLFDGEIGSRSGSVRSDLSQYAPPRSST